MSRFAMYFAVNMFILMTVSDFGHLPAQWVQKVEEGRVQILGRCEPCNISCGAEYLAFKSCNFKR
jgi:hypothetical protein